MSMTQASLRPLIGMLILHKDPSDKMHVSKDGKVRLHMPDVEHREAQTGLVYVHEQSSDFDEDLTGQHVVFTKWSEKEFTLTGADGSIATFAVIDERDVLAVISQEQTP
jgi:co-chaperonin GroES (HSP10)